MSPNTAPPATVPSPPAGSDDCQPFTCPSCQTTDPHLSKALIAAGSSWTCARCNQRWDAARLATATAYAAWVAERAGVNRRSGSGPALRVA